MKEHRKKNGQVLVLVALTLPLMLGFIGFAVDVGILVTEKQKLQVAADSAAIAGAAEINYGDWTSVAQNAASLNGYTNGSNGVTVSVNPSASTVPTPLYGPYAGQPGFLEVIVTESVPTYFMQLFNFPTVPVQTRAVAGLGVSSNCIYILGGSGETLNMSNNSKLNAPGCGVVVDSNGSPAVSVQGSAAITASSVSVNGSATSGNGGSISPAATTGVVPVSDPLAYLSPPSYSASSCTADPLTHYGQGGSSYTVGPGSNYSTTQDGNLVCYTSLTLGQNNDTVTLNAGIYVITGAMTANSGTTLGGNGVTFYLVGNGSVNIQNGATVNFTAPTSGSYDGILFFQDRADTNADYVEGGANSTLKGILYFPSAQLNMANGTTTTVYTPIVANSLVMAGGGTLTDSSYGSINPSDPLTSPRLVE